MITLCTFAICICNIMKSKEKIQLKFDDKEAGMNSQKEMFFTSEYWFPWEHILKLRRNSVNIIFHPSIQHYKDQKFCR